MTRHRFSDRSGRNLCDRCNQWAGSPDHIEAPYGASVVNGELLVELAAREAGRRKHRNWKRVSAMELIAVLRELGFRIEMAA